MFQWFLTSEGKNYTDNIERFYRIGEELLVVPSEEEIKSAILNRKKFNVIAPYPPPEKFKNLFVLQDIDAFDGLTLTTQELEFLLHFEDKNEREKMETILIREKLGLRVHKPTVKLSELGGMKRLKEFAEYVKKVNHIPELRIKGIFLVGIPGTGKSYSAMAFAGELNRLLIELNISKIMESVNPVTTLQHAFMFIEKLRKPCIIWIDEVEKAFSLVDPIEKRVYGQLLTIMNDLNTEIGFKIDGFFWVTANDITYIMERSPEFLRRGRFDALFFVDVPDTETAKELFEIYLRKYNLTIYKNNIPLDVKTASAELVFLSSVEWHEESATTGAVEGKSFVYTPAEIHQIIKELARKEKTKGFVSLDDAIEVIKGLEPIGSSMTDAIAMMRKQSRYFVKV